MRRYLSLSFIIHALFICAWFLISLGRDEVIDASKYITIEMVPSAQQIARKDKVEDDSQTKRIVQTKKVKKSEKAAPDAFLGEQTQMVDRETVSKSQLTASEDSKQGKNTPKEQREAAESKRAGAKNDNAKNLAVLGLPLFKGQEGEGKTGAGPKQEYSEWAGSGSHAQDYVKGFKESERTVLNTKEYVFYGYFQRIRQRLDLAWQPILREHLTKFYKRGRHLASEMDHRTRVLVTLNLSGEIVRVQLLEESGISDLDDAAIKAFNKAGPFPNPPRGIINPEGLVLIRWDFVLKT